MQVRTTPPRAQTPPGAPGGCYLLTPRTRRADRGFMGGAGEGAGAGEGEGGRLQAHLRVCWATLTPLNHTVLGTKTGRFRVGQSSEITPRIRLQSCLPQLAAGAEHGADRNMPGGAQSAAAAEEAKKAQAEDDDNEGEVSESESESEEQEEQEEAPPPKKKKRAKEEKKKSGEAAAAGADPPGSDDESAAPSKRKRRRRAA